MLLNELSPLCPGFYQGLKTLGQEILGFGLRASADFLCILKGEVQPYPQMREGRRQA